MNTDVVIYQSSDGLVKMEAIVDASNETIWATQKAMAELFYRYSIAKSLTR